MRELRNQAHALEVDGDLMLDRARQDMRREMLPLEQAPQVVAAASKVLQGTNLSVYGDDARLLGQLEPIFGILASHLRSAAGEPVAAAPSAGAGAA